MHYSTNDKGIGLKYLSKMCVRVQNLIIVCDGALVCIGSNTRHRLFDKSFIIDTPAQNTRVNLLIRSENSHSKNAEDYEIILCNVQLYIPT